MLVIFSFYVVIHKMTFINDHVIILVVKKLLEERKDNNEANKYWN